MKAVRLSEKEAWVLNCALTEAGVREMLIRAGHKERAIDSVLSKLERAMEPSANAAVGPIEDALVASSRGKVVPLVTGHGQASVRAGKMGVTPEAARTVGEWMARTSWLKGPVTLLGVLNKWADWYSKATATAPPPAVGPGFTGEDSAQAKRGTEGPSSGPAGRLRPGFKR